MAKKAEETNPAVIAEGPEIGLTITKVDPKEFGLEEKNTKSISDAFLPKIAERDGYIGVYKNILTMEISDETCKQARRLRLDLVPVRTGIEKIRKAEKESLVAEGKYIDALAKKHSLPIEQMEEKLLQIEEHFANIEKAKKEKLKSARLLLLEDYPDFDPQFVDLANMDGPTFEKLLSQQEDLKKFKAEQAIKQQAEEDAKQRKAELEEKRTAETLKYSDFIVNYENIFLSELSEEDYQAMLTKAKADKQADDEQKAKIKADNARLEAENKAIADKAAKEQADLAAKLKAEQEAAAKQKAIDDAKIKALAKEKAEAEEKEKIRAARNSELRPYIVFIRDYNNVLSMPEEDYQKEFIDIKLQAQQQFEFEQKEAAKKEALAKEQEELRQKEIAEQQERERLAKEAKDKAEAALAEERRLAKEESDRQAEIIKKQQEENERLAKEAKDKAEAEAAAQAKEKADKEAADKAKKAEEEKAAIKAAKAPDKDKLNKIIDDAVLILPREGYKSPEAEQMETNILNKFNAFKKWAKEEIEKL